MATEQDKFFQREYQQFLKSEALQGPWVTVFRIEPIRDGLSIFSALIEKGHRRRILEDAGWDLRYGDGGPSICTSYEQGRPVHEYLRLSHGWIEPIAHHRTFPSRDSYLELSEEFRLYHQLYYDAKRACYLKFHDDGHEEEAAVIDGMTARVKLHLLSDYLAVRQMDFVLFFEGNYWTKSTLEELGASQANDFSEQGELIRMDFQTSAPAFIFTDDTKSTSTLRGKLILPCSTESIPDPSAPREEDYPEFIIGHDQNGKPVKNSCDPESLDNNFRKNPGAPHYLTRVHFRREVLQKYYDNPQDFTVGDGIVRRSNVWDMRLDNDHPDRVIAFLGDLGRDLPESERHHWMAHNISPEGDLSKTAHTRSMRGWFADPVSPDLVFKREYERVNREWEQKRGWPIFRPLRPDDAHVLKTIRIPLNENPAEFDNFSLAMTKVLIDSLNEAELGKSITLADGDKGITKLQKYLINQDGPDPSISIKFLRNLQDLRIGSAHRKNTKHEEACAAFGIEQGFKAAGTAALTQAVVFLEHLRSILQEAS
jgi:hypothetical protein